MSFRAASGGEKSVISNFYRDPSLITQDDELHDSRFDCSQISRQMPPRNDKKQVIILFLNGSPHEPFIFNPLFA
jgi:hypothetical protein